MKQTMYVSIDKWAKGDPNPDYILSKKNPKYDFYIGLGETEVSFEVPPMPSDEALTNRQIDFLRKGRKETVKEFATKLENIDNQIQELLALPCLEG
jgi:hypothetical protein